MGIPGGLGGSGNLLADGGGGTESLPGAVGGKGREGEAAFKVVGALPDFGRLICIVVRDSSLAAGVVGRSMRMVSRIVPLWEGRLMRMVSFFASPMRTVSFLTPGVWGG